MREKFWDIEIPELSSSTKVAGLQEEAFVNTLQELLSIQSHIIVNRKALNAVKKI